MEPPNCREALDCANPLAFCRNAQPVEMRQRAGARGQPFAWFCGSLRPILRATFALLVLGAVLRSAAAQELVVIVESPAFALDTRLASGSGTAALVVTTVSPAFTVDTRLSSGSPLSGLVVTAQSAAFALDTRLAGTEDDLIVHAVSPPFTLNTMWVGIRRTARVTGNAVELYWPTNAPGFHLQFAAPLPGPSTLWMDVTNAVSESGGLFRIILNPASDEHYFRLKL